MINVVNLTKDYGGTRALNNLSFNVNQGEAYGFLGSAGAGKTTIARILAGVISPTSGSVTINDLDISFNKSRVQATLGYMPSLINPSTNITAREFLKYFGALRKIKANKQRIDEVLSVCGLLNIADKRFSTLDLEMKRKLSLAQSIIHQPQLLILDEPTSGLNQTQSNNLCEVIKTVLQQLTIIVTSETLSAVQRLCNRIHVIERGVSVIEDTPYDLQLKLAGATRVNVKVAGDIQSAISITTQIKGIQTVNPIDQNSYYFITSPGFTPGSEVVQSLVNANLQVLEFIIEPTNKYDMLMKYSQWHPENPGDEFPDTRNLFLE